MRTENPGCKRHYWCYKQSSVVNNGVFIFDETFVIVPFGGPLYRKLQRQGECRDCICGLNLRSGLIFVSLGTKFWRDQVRENV